MQVDASSGEQAQEIEQSEAENLSKKGPAASSQIGSERATNEDRYLIETFSCGTLCVVCDGMGGVAGGDIAAQMAVDSLKQSITAASLSNPHDTLVNALNKANSDIFNRRQTTSTYSMGTTVVAALTTEREGSIIHVGDSRVYVVQGRTICQLTQDHTYVQDWVEQGIMGEKEVNNHPQAHVLNKCLGTMEGVTPSIVDFEILPLQEGDTEDRLVFLTDGVHRLVSKDEICELVRRMPPAQGCIHVLELAKGRDGSDDMTVAILPLGGKFQPQQKSNKSSESERRELSTLLEARDQTTPAITAQETEQQPLVLTAPEQEATSTLPGWGDSMHFEETLSRKDYVDPVEDISSTDEDPVQSVQSLLNRSTAEDIISIGLPEQLLSETEKPQNKRGKKLFASLLMLGLVLGGAGLILYRLSSFSVDQTANKTIAPPTEDTSLVSSSESESSASEESIAEVTGTDTATADIATNDEVVQPVTLDPALETPPVEQTVSAPESDLANSEPNKPSDASVENIAAPLVVADQSNLEATPSAAAILPTNAPVVTDETSAIPEAVTVASSEPTPDESQATPPPLATETPVTVPTEINAVPNEAPAEVQPPIEVPEPQGPTAIDYFKQGLEHTKAKDLKAARKAFEQALALDPTMAEAHYNLGTMLASEKNPSIAIEEFKRALETRPDFTEALYNLGFVYYKIGNKEAARNYFEQFVGSANKTQETRGRFKPQINAVREILKDLY